MITLVLNAGSSSLKFQLVRMPENTLLAKGLIEKIGKTDAIFKYANVKKNISIDTTMNIQNHTDGLATVLEHMTNEAHGAIASLQEIGSVGHRVVH